MRSTHVPLGASKTRHSRAVALSLGITLAAATSAAAGPPLGGTWQPIGPSGGQVMALAVDPQHPATIYAGTLGGGLYRSDDFGRSWSARGLDTWINVNSVTIDPVASDIVYAGVASAQAGGGLWKSLDGGSRWHAAGAGLPPGGFGGVSALVIDPLTPSTLYAQAGGGLWKSVDGAHSWAALPLTMSSAFGGALAIDPQRPAVLYAGGNTGLFKSSDGGATWAPAARLRNLVVTSVVVDPALPCRVYAGTLQDLPQNGPPSKRPTLFLSTDRGGTWHRADSGLAPQGTCPGCPGIGLGKQSVFSLALSPAAHLTVYAGTSDGVWKSTNGGGSWSAANAGLARIVADHLAADPQTSGRLYAGVVFDFPNAAPGVWKTANGGAAWRTASAGIDASDVGALVVDPTATGILYAAVPGAGVLKRQGGGWQPANQGLTGAQVSALVIDPQQPLILYAKTEAGFWKTVDGAANWSQPSPGTAVAAPPLLIDPQTPTTLYAMGGGEIQKSLDGGVTWTRRAPAGSFAAAYDAALAPSAPQNLYWLTAITIGIHTFDLISHSSDGGLSIDSQGTAGSGSLGTLAVDPRDPATAYVAALVAVTSSGPSYGLLKTTDSGGSYAALPLSCEPACSALVFAPGPPQTLYAAGGDTVVASTDGGASWTPVGDPLPAGAGIASMAFDPSSETLFVATRYRGVYQLTP